MKREQTFSLITLSLLACLIGVYSIGLLFNPLSEKNDSSIKEDDRLEPRIPKTSYTWDYTEVILINGTDEACDWAWVDDQEWFGGGTGVEGDPYILEDIRVIVDDADNPAFKIVDSEAYFVLNGSEFKNANADGDGLYLSNVTHGYIDTCNCSESGRYGLYMNNVNSTTIDTCTINENEWGIYADNCVLNIILSTTINENTADGLTMLNCTYNDISSSYMDNNGEDGCYIADSDLNNFTVDSSENTENGMVLIDSDECILNLCQFINNTLVGLALIEDDGDTQANNIYGNYFEGTDTAHDNSTGTGNTWDNGVDSGNTWVDAFSRYGIVDLDDDGIGDDPYNITGTAEAQDLYPVLDDGDDIAPAITITKPTTGQIFIYAPAFTVSITDEVGVITRWYTVDEGSHNTTFTGSSGTISAVEWSRITGDEGRNVVVVLTFYADDEAGNIGSASVVIYKTILEDDEDETEIETYSFNREVIIGVTVFSLALFMLRRFWAKP